MNRTAAFERSARVAGLRASGRVSEALAALNAALDDHGDEPAVLRESLRLALLVGEPELALGVHGRLLALGGADALRGLEAALARLRLELPGREVESPPRGSGKKRAAWLEQDDGNALAPAELTEIRASSPGGGIRYEIRAGCPWCEAPQRLSVRMSLLLDRDWLCPSCFGRIALRYEGVRDFLRRRHPLLVSDGAYDWNEAFLGLLRDLGTPREENGGQHETPSLCRELNQQYVFFLSQALTRRLYGSES